MDATINLIDKYYSSISTCNLNNYFLFPLLGDFCMVGLADCNNFFVSCERSRNESLKNRPVVVLSNNDGCVVARSNEAKRLGIKMGQPAFEIRHLVLGDQVIALSGNHLLYRDISLKVHDIFRRYAPRTIDYSVDEAFLIMDGIPQHILPSIGEAIAEEAHRKLDIPVTIGFAPTKTLAKIVTEDCKHSGRFVGLLPNDPEAIEPLLKETQVGELWGIGRRLARKLYLSGVFTASDLARRERVWIRGHFGVNGERTWRELHGEPCIELEHIERPLQDSISETRTFPEDVDDYDYIRARIAIYAADCARQLRKMRGLACRVAVFMATNPFHPERLYYRPYASFDFPDGVSDTVTIVKKAIELLDSVFKPDIPVKRAGVILSEIEPDRMQTSLFATEDEISRSTVNRKLMKAVDSLNPGVGHPCIRLASQIVCGHAGHNDGYSSSFQSPKK